MSALNLLTELRLEWLEAGSHIVPAEDSVGWKHCEHGLELPPQLTIVPVVFRTLKGVAQGSAFWQHTQFTDAFLQNYVQAKGKRSEEDWDKFLQQYVQGITWNMASGKPLVGVVAWYKVPIYNIGDYNG